MFAVSASREGGALVFDNLLKYIVQNCFGVVRVIDLRAYSQYVTALFDVVLDVIVTALICQLGHFNLFACKLLVEVIEI